MKHWYVTGPEQLELIDEPIPTPGPNDVLVRVTHTALSPGSNLHAFRTGSYGATWTPGRVDVVYMASGVIEAVGEHVNPSRVGERIATNGIGHQEYAVVDSSRAYPVRTGLSLRDASLAYLSAWSVSALHLGEYAAAETVVIVGLGLVGASAALTANLMGARVLGLDTSTVRLALAESLGLGAVEDVAALAENGHRPPFLGADGPDLIIETSGNWSGFRTAINLARDHTRIALMGIYREPPPTELSQVLVHEMFAFPSKFHYQRLRIIGVGSDPESISEPMPRMATRSRNFSYVLEQAANGRLNVGKLVTTTVNADQIESVLTRLAAGDQSELGVVFEWKQT